MSAPLSWLEFYRNLTFQFEEPEAPRELTKSKSGQIFNIGKKKETSKTPPASPRLKEGTEESSLKYPFGKIRETAIKTFDQLNSILQLAKADVWKTGNPDKPELHAQRTKEFQELILSTNKQAETCASLLDKPNDLSSQSSIEKLDQYTSGKTVATEYERACFTLKAEVFKIQLMTASIAEDLFPQLKIPFREQAGEQFYKGHKEGIGKIVGTLREIKADSLDFYKKFTELQTFATEFFSPQPKEETPPLQPDKNPTPSKIKSLRDRISRIEKRQALFILITLVALGVFFYYDLGRRIVSSFQSATV